MESKQFKYKNNVATELIEHNGIQLNSPNDKTKLPTQMSDKWIEYVGLKLENAGKTNTSDMLLYKDKITKYVSAIDKTTGEIHFLKLDKFN